MTVLYRPGLCEKCKRGLDGAKFCARKRFRVHFIKRRSEIINDVVVHGPYPSYCSAFSEKVVA